MTEPARRELFTKEDRTGRHNWPHMWLLGCDKESKLHVSFVDLRKRLTSPDRLDITSNIELKVILEPISMFLYFKMEYLWIWGA